jgi:hypothetical protein
MSEEATNTFLPQVEVMDLRDLYSKVFITAVSTGPREDGKLLAKTIHGPYEFDDMIGEVGRMWSEDQNNAKVYVLEKDPKVKSKWLDVNTIDYIISNYADILLDRMLSSDDKTYTCKAGVVGEEEPEAPAESVEIKDEVPF